MSIMMKSLARFTRAGLLALLALTLPMFAQAAHRRNSGNQRPRRGHGDGGGSYRH